MISEDGFLSALSFGNKEGPLSRLPSATPRRGTPSPPRDASEPLSYTVTSTPTLYSAQSSSAVYLSAYPPEVYTYSAESGAPVASPSTTYKPYMYGSWATLAPELGSRTVTARSAELHAHAVLSEAEQQRHILQLERELAEEQRQRLAARLSPCSPGTRPSASISGDRSPFAEAPGDAAQHCALETSLSPPPDPSYDALEGELRGFSTEALAPPSSPSPPSAHVQSRWRVCEKSGGVDVPGAGAAGSTMSPHEGTPPHAFPSPPPSTPGIATRTCLAGAAVSPPECPSQGASPPRSSPPSCGLTEETMPSSSAGERCVSARMSCTGALPPSPVLIPAQPVQGSSPRQLVPPPPFYEVNDSKASHPTPSAVHREMASTQEEDERLYDAYRRKLTRIHEALRLSSGAGVLCGTASIEARRAHQLRGPLRTPTLSPVPTPASRPSPPQVPSPDLIRTCTAPPPPPSLSLSSSFPHASSEVSRVRRPLSTGFLTDDVPPLPRGHGHHLRWDLAHSGNIVVSSDGYACRADATDALTLIEREYEGRLGEMLHRLVIPFYVLGNRGVTRGSLTFAFHWVSSATKCHASVSQRRGRRCLEGDVAETGSDIKLPRVPALAFGFTTRSFTGYGTQVPAFLYLSSGAIAQGVHTSTCTGAERPYGLPYEPGMELAARLDLERGCLEFYVDGVSMGIAFRFVPALHPAPLFPVVLFSADMDVAELLYSV
ncbi:hypothetical protein JKF63_04529 [Porcisia hertigi]|uniref:B30.2/SPRY domain-containing protein n=1 Tax=Porcisia hertigi TaxID=2761500 RepID=A0A836LAC9_9TRYP|nr:hypothetical protein JKF63_04529 [Porcisia hertigi]